MVSLMISENKKSPSSWLLLAMAAFIPPLFATGFTRFEWLKSSTWMVIGGLAVLFWALSLLKGDKKKWNAPKSGALLLAFGFYALISIIWSTSGIAGFDHALGLLLFALIPLLLSTADDLNYKDLGISIGVGMALTSAMNLLDLAGVEVFSLIWDAPGYTGAFDGAAQESIYLALGLIALSVFVSRTEGWKEKFILFSMVLSSIPFGFLASLALIITTFAVIAVVVFLTRLESSKKVYGGVIVTLIVSISAAFLVPKVDPSLSVANKVPAIYTQRIINADQLIALKIQNDHFDIDRIADLDDDVSTYLNSGEQLLSDTKMLVLGRGAGSWWTDQSRIYKEDHKSSKIEGFRFYKIFRTSHDGVELIYEVGLIGLLFLVLFLISALRKKRKESIFFAIFTLAMFSPYVLELSSVQIILALCLGVFLKELPNDNIELNSDTTKGISLLLAVVVAISGLGFIGWGGYTGVARMKSSRGDLLMLRKKYKLAAKAYEEAYSFSDHSPSLSYNYAIALRKIGKHKEATEAANSALLKRPDDARFIFLVAELQFKQDEITKAIESAKKAVDHFPNHINARKLLTLMYDKMGRRKESNETLLNILKVNPPIEVARQTHNDLGQSFSILAMPQKALKHYREALVLESDPIQKRSLKIRISRIETKLEEERLMREGKPIPELLKRKLEEGKAHDGHGH